MESIILFNPSGLFLFNKDKEKELKGEALFRPMFFLK